MKSFASCPKMAVYWSSLHCSACWEPALHSASVNYMGERQKWVKLRNVRTPVTQVRRRFFKRPPEFSQRTLAFLTNYHLKESDRRGANHERTRTKYFQEHRHKGQAEIKARFQEGAREQTTVAKVQWSRRKERMGENEERRSQDHRGEEGRLLVTWTAMETTGRFSSRGVTTNVWFREVIDTALSECSREKPGQEAVYKERKCLILGFSCQGREE